MTVLTAAWRQSSPARRPPVRPPRCTFQSVGAEGHSQPVYTRRFSYSLTFQPSVFTAWRCRFHVNPFPFLRCALETASYPTMHFTSDSSNTVESAAFKIKGVQICAKCFSRLRTFEKETGGSSLLKGEVLLMGTTATDKNLRCCIAPHTPATSAKTSLQVPALLLTTLNPSDRWILSILTKGYFSKRWNIRASLLLPSAGWEDSASWSVGLRSRSAATWRKPTAWRPSALTSDAGPGSNTITMFNPAVGIHAATLRFPPSVLAP